MSIIPGLSTQQRLEIQLKLDKIISQDFLNICPHFAQKNENFNLKLSKYILSSENCKFNSNLAKNFHFKIYNLHKIEHMNEFESCLPIATSDKSEAYMGYATINGDMSGGFAPIADVPKTKLFAFSFCKYSLIIKVHQTSLSIDI